MRTNLIRAAIVMPIASLGLVACGGADDPEEATVDDMAMESQGPAAPQLATAMLMTAEGEEVGTVTASGSAGGVTIDIEAMNMPAGEHGVHVHETGECEPDFTAAGGHWNPDDSPHGLEGDDGQHAGDMPNLEVGEDGSGTLSYMLAPSATFEGLLEGDGSAFIVHAGADDQTSQPSGDSGDRIACGVFSEG